MWAYDDLASELKSLVRSRWRERDGLLLVPSEDSVAFGRDAVRINAAVLYASLSGSTALIEYYRAAFAATAYKAFLIACQRMVKHFGGAVTACDGDRVMAVYMGDSKCTRAARTALAIEAVMTHLVNPELAEAFNGLDYDFYLRHVTGIDVSDLFVINTGVKQNSSLAWIGRAANTAAKLCSMREGPYRSFITDDVFRALANNAKHYGGQLMWEARTWNGSNVHRSRWWVSPHA